MRTTLDIDDDVLQAAKELAAADKTTAGKVLSALARKALTGRAEVSESRSAGRPRLKDGWYVLPSTGRIVTHEMIERLIEQADLEDAGLLKDE
jgi:hypothetical protein